MTSYRIVRRLSDKLAAVAREGENVYQLWHVAPLRKARVCQDCGAEIPKGSDAWAPLTHAVNRSHRVHVGCLK